MIESPKNFIEQFQNFIEHIAGVMKTFLTKEVADNYYLGKSEKAVSADSVQWGGVKSVPDNVKNALSFTAQSLTPEQKTQSLQNQGVIQALEELIEENGGTVPTSLTENSVQTMSAQSADPWAEYD